MPSRRRRSALSRWTRLSGSFRSRNRAAAEAAVVAAEDSRAEPDGYCAAREGTDRGDVEASRTKRIRDCRSKGAATGKLLSEAQVKLKRAGAGAEHERMQSRDLAQANEEFNSFDKDMEIAAAGMQPAADKLKQHAVAGGDAAIEQKVLQALLRAEATFRKIEVAFGQRGGGWWRRRGGGSAGPRSGEPLRPRDGYGEEPVRDGADGVSKRSKQEKKVDDALAKLDALAKRQEELAQPAAEYQAQNVPAAVATGDAAARGGAVAARDGADAWPAARVSRRQRSSSDSRASRGNRASRGSRDNRDSSRGSRDSRARGSRDSQDNRVRLGSRVSQGSRVRLGSRGKKVRRLGRLDSRDNRVASRASRDRVRRRGRSRLRTRSRGRRMGTLIRG